MKNVNLLPAWYLQQHRSQRLFRVHIVVMLLVGGVMVGSIFWGREQVNSLQHQRNGLAATLNKIGDPALELARQQANLKRLEDLRSARQELGNTVPMSLVLQQLRNEMTTGMALSNVTIDVRPEPIQGTGFVGDARNPPRMRDVAHITVSGIAPKNGRIGELFERLAKKSLFSEVTLDYSRAATLKGYLIERFGIQMNMDMELLAGADPAALTGVRPSAPAAITAVHPIGPETFVPGEAHGQ